MAQKSKDPSNRAGYIKGFLAKPHTITLVIVWLLVSISLVIMLAGGVRNTGLYRDERYLLQAVYVLALIYYLIRTGSSGEHLPEINPVILPSRRVGRLIPAFFIAILFAGELLGMGLIQLLMIPASIWVLIVWRRDIRLPAVLASILVCVIAIGAGWEFYKYQYISQSTYFWYAIFVIPMFIAGGLLIKHTGLGGNWLYSGRFGQALLSFLKGCLLFIPLGLFNAAAGSPGSWMTWIDHWWEPFSQPLFSGIVEETWWRLFFIGLLYFLLRPAFRKYPAIAVVGAILFSATAFGLGHGGTFYENLLNIGMLFGLPMAVVFVRRDWEHSVGAHYMINMIPTLMVFLGA